MLVTIFLETPTASIFFRASNKEIPYWSAYLSILSIELAPIPRFGTLIILLKLNSSALFTITFKYASKSRTSWRCKNLREPINLYGIPKDRHEFSIWRER